MLQLSQVIGFRSTSLNIDETIPFTVPRLLDARTIKAIHDRLEANRIYLHGKPKHDYLLGGSSVPFVDGC